MGVNVTWERLNYNKIAYETSSACFTYFAVKLMKNFNKQLYYTQGFKSHFWFTDLSVSLQRDSEIPHSCLQKRTKTQRRLVQLFQGRIIGMHARS